MKRSMLILQLETCSYFDRLSMNGHGTHTNIYTKPTRPITLSSSKGEFGNGGILTSSSLIFLTHFLESQRNSKV